MKMSCFCIAFCVVGALTGLASAAGFVHSQTFLVFTPKEPSRELEQAFAQAVLEKAEQYRLEIAKEWFGEELPHGLGRTCINVSLSSSKDRGLTWAKDHPDRLHHNLYLTTSRERALGSTLKHEITHVVFATRFEQSARMASWVEEGIASNYDDTVRKQARQSILRQWTDQRKWPRLDSILSSKNIRSQDTSSYTSAWSLTEFLVQRAPRETLFDFASYGRKHDWDGALQRYYGIRDTHQLQEQWQNWVTKSATRPTL